MAKDGLTTRAWFRWCPRDFLCDHAVGSMTREQRMSYREALDFSWMSETPGVEREDQWRRWLGFDGLDWEVVRSVFAAAFAVFSTDGHGEVWVQRHLLSEWYHATHKSQQASTAGQRSFNVRSTSVDGRSTSVVRGRLESKKKKNQDSCSPAAPDERQIPLDPARMSESLQKAKAAREWASGFHEHFWPKYPRKVGKGAALIAWGRLLNGARTEDELQAQFDPIMAGLHRWVAEHHDAELQFIPHPATWINQRRWEDQTP